MHTSQKGGKKTAKRKNLHLGRSELRRIGSPRGADKSPPPPSIRPRALLLLLLLLLLLMLLLRLLLLLLLSLLLLLRRGEGRPGRGGDVLLELAV